MADDAPSGSFDSPSSRDAGLGLAQDDSLSERQRQPETVHTSSEDRMMTETENPKSRAVFSRILFDKISEDCLGALKTTFPL